MQLALTPAPPALTPERVPLRTPSRLSAPSTGDAGSLYASTKPWSKVTADVPVADAVATATRHLDSVGAARDARSAADLLHGAAKSVLVARRGGQDVGISPALDSQLADVAINLASTARAALREPGTGSVQLGPDFSTTRAQAVDVLAVLADHVERVEQQVANGVYL